MYINKGVNGENVCLYMLCSTEPIIDNPNTCQRNEDCESQKACYQDECIDPCSVANCPHPYGCTVVNHLFYCIEHKGMNYFTCKDLSIFTITYLPSKQ